jgi:hypothetical protein
MQMLKTLALAVTLGTCAHGFSSAGITAAEATPSPSSTTAAPEMPSPVVPLDDLIAPARPSRVTAGAMVTTQGWLTQVQGAADSTYTLQLADGPGAGAPYIVIRLPLPDRLPPGAAALRQADADARQFVKQTLLHGAEPDLRPWPLIHRPHIWLTGQLVSAPTGGPARWEIAPATRFSFVSLAHASNGAK